MPFIPNLFITPHAIEQFQQRIALLPEDKARGFILEGVHKATNVRVLPDGTSLRVRTRRPFPFEFRTFCILDLERGHYVVTTVVRGDSNVTRKQKRNPPSADDDSACQ